MGSACRYHRRNSRNSLVLTRSWDEVKKFFTRPKLDISPIIKTNAFGWKLRNNGDSTAYDLRLGIRIRSGDGSIGYGSFLLTKKSLDSQHDIDILFTLNPVHSDNANAGFSLATPTHHFEEPAVMHLQKWPPEPALSLGWKSNYAIEIEYRHQDSDETVHFKLELGSREEASIKQFAEPPRSRHFQKLRGRLRSHRF